MKAVLTDELLGLLIQDLTAYKKSGVYDPWIIRSDGELLEVEPLDALVELQRLRQAK